MTARQDEASLRGHGVRSTACDHAGTLVKVEPPAPASVLFWCNRCGAFNVLGEWRQPTLVERYDTAVRDRDTMHETLTIVQGRCTELLNEVRSLKAQLTTNREVNRGALEVAIKIGDTQRTALERVAAELGVSVEWLVSGNGPLLARVRQ